jgi:hypothetical protein
MTIHSRPRDFSRTLRGPRILLVRGSVATSKSVILTSHNGLRTSTLFTSTTCHNLPKGVIPTGVHHSYQVMCLSVIGGLVLRYSARYFRAHEYVSGWTSLMEMANASSAEFAI